jgi:poly(3-hydroxybutyrate) depolymerase
MSGHHATLLRGTVEALLPDHEVYITDWVDARMVPVIDRTFDLDDYVDYIVEILRLLGPGTHVMGVCQPSVPVVAAVSLMSTQKDPATPRSMVLMGGPIDVRRNPTLPNKLAMAKPIEWFENNAIQSVPLPYPGFTRRVYPGFLQLTGFMTMNLGRHIDAHKKLFRHLVGGDGDSAAQHRSFYDEYLSVMDLTAEFYLQTTRVVFQEQRLARGTWEHRGSKIEPGAITKTALMCVEGERDDISGLGQTEAALELCRNLPSSKKVHYVQRQVGHYGVFNGSRWRNEIKPRVAQFIRAHDRSGADA